MRRPKDAWKKAGARPGESNNVGSPKVKIQFLPDDQVQQTFRKIASEQKRLVVNANVYNNVIERGKAHWSQLTLGMNQALGVFQSLISAGKTLWKLTKETARAMDLDINAMDALHVKMKSMEDLRKSSGGTISDEDLQRMFLTAEQVGITVEKFQEMERIALALSNKIGDETTPVLQRLLVAIQSGRTESLKRLGINIEMNKELQREAVLRGLIFNELSAMEKINLSIDIISRKTLETKKKYLHKLSRQNKLEKLSIANAEDFGMRLKTVGSIFEGLVTGDWQYFDEVAVPHWIDRMNNIAAVLSGNAKRMNKVGESMLELVRIINNPLAKAQKSVHNYMSQVSGDVYTQQRALDKLTNDILDNIEALQGYEDATGQTAKSIKNLNNELIAVDEIFYRLQKSMTAFEEKTNLAKFTESILKDKKKRRAGKIKPFVDVESITHNITKGMWGLLDPKTVTALDDLNAKIIAVNESLDMTATILQGGIVDRLNEDMATQMVNAIDIQVDSLSYFLDSTTVLTNNAVDTYSMLGAAAMDMFNAWGKGHKQGLKSTGAFFGELTKMHKAFALFLAPFYFAEGLAHLSHMDWALAAFAFASSAKYAYVGGMALANAITGSGGQQKTAGHQREMPSGLSSTAQQETKTEHHYHIYAPIHGSMEELQVTWHDETQQLVERGLIAEG